MSKTKISDLWQTPRELFETLNKEFKFNYDVCANESNKLAPCLGDYFTEEYSNCTCFMNPPFSNSLIFVRRAITLSYNNVLTVCLLKADTSTKVFHELYDYSIQKAKPGIEIRFFPKRIQYTHPLKLVSGCAFPSMLAIIYPFRVKHE